jgi:hypothetical protein
LELINCLRYIHCSSRMWPGKQKRKLQYVCVTKSISGIILEAAVSVLCTHEKDLRSTPLRWPQVAWQTHTHTHTHIYILVLVYIYVYIYTKLQKISTIIQLILRLLFQQFERSRWWYYWLEGFMKHAVEITSGRINIHTKFHDHRYGYWNNLKVIESTILDLLVLAILTRESY